MANYLDPVKREKSYLTENEYVEDMLSWLDMTLGIALAVKEGECSQPVYLRGSSVTYEEVKRAVLVIPSQDNNALPSEIRKQICDGMKYIRLRTNVSDKFIEKSRIWQLIATYRMDTTQRIALWLYLAPLYDKKFERIYAFLNNSVTIDKPTSAILKSVFYLMGQVCEPDAINKLICGLGELIRVNENDEIIIPNCVKMWLLGGECMTEKLSYYCHRLTHSAEIIANKEQYQKLSEYVKSDKMGSSVICFQGKVGMGKKTFATNLCQEMNLGMVVILMSRLNSVDKKELGTIQKEILALCTVSKSLVYLDFCDLSYEDVSTVSVEETIEELLKYYQYVFIGTDEPLPSGLCNKFPILEVTLNATDSQSRLLLWKKALEGSSIAKEMNIEEIAGKYSLTPCEIMTVGKQAELMSQYNGRGCIIEQDIREAVSFHSRSFRSQYATKITGTFTWDDLIVSRKTKNKLMLACDRMKHRYILNEKYGLGKKYSYGTGICLLMYGPPGTGKTMSAQIIANEVGLDIYRIDLSRITSKYVGETEKNLSVIFEEAKSANLILFFDEADSLFAKRTEIHGSNDKYSNAETSYILQKIEEYDGMCILATNLLTNFDPALMRRITYAVGFEAPDADTRYTLWTGIFGDMLNVDPQIDFHFFADKFELSGSSIKAILYNAACLAVNDDSPITARHLVQALKYEYEKLGKFFNSGMLEAYASYNDEE